MIKFITPKKDFGQDVHSYWVYKVDDNSFKLAESREKAYLGETLTITSGSGSGTPHTFERQEYDYHHGGSGNIYHYNHNMKNQRFYSGSYGGRTADLNVYAG